MRSISILLIVLFLLSSCSPITSQTQTASAPPLAPGTPAGEVYPIPQELTTTVSAYPVQPESVNNAPLVTPDPSKAVVTGRLLLNGTPVTEGIIYLSEIISDNEGTEIVAGFSRESPLRGDMDSTGAFKVVNVLPGRYGVVYDLVSDAVLLNAPGKDESFIITVSEGEALDLGDLNYLVLPTR